MESKATTQILRTKLHRPQLSVDFILRQQLLEQLEQHRQLPLTLVSASAGYGKSTLISSWLESVVCPSAWLSLDEHDNELVGFLTYVIAALQTVFPGFGKEIQSLVGAVELPPLPVLAGNLINELEAIEQPFILVLDDYHLIKEHTIHELLGELLRHPPRFMHLVLICRHDPPLPFSTLRARGLVNELRAINLRFSRRETGDFLQKILGQPEGHTR
jgi:LuxR family maltose regulon positive regulatory protein